MQMSCIPFAITEWDDSRPPGTQEKPGLPPGKLSYSATSACAWSKTRRDILRIIGAIRGKTGVGAKLFIVD